MTTPPAPPRTPLIRSWLRMFVLGLVACGCATTVRDQQRAFDRVEAHRIDGEPVRQYLDARKVRLFGGADRVEVEVRDGQARLSWHFEPVEEALTEPQKGFRFTMPPMTTSLAAPLETPGYFLTAAHTTEHGPIHLVWEHGPHTRAARAEVVWADEKADLALLRADLGEIPVFPWAGHVVRDARAFVAAARSPTAGCFRGVRTRRLREDGAEIDTFTVRHDCPVRDGDSGGAVVDERGALVGVHSATGLDLLRLSKIRIAVRPDVDQLGKLIRAHSD